MARRSRKRRKNGVGKLVVTLLLVGLLAIGCGWLINRLIVQGYLFGSDLEPNGPNTGTLPPDNPPSEPGGQHEEPPLPAVTEAQLSMQSFRCYLPQVGALSNVSGAEGLVQQLSQQNYPAAYAQEGGFFKVFAGIYAERDAAQAVGTLLQQLGHDVFIKEIILPGGRYDVAGSMADYFAQAAQQVTALEGAFGQMLRPTAIDGEQAASLQRQVDAAHERLSTMGATGDAVRFHSQLLEACADLLGAANQLCSYLDSSNEMDLLQMQVSLMEFVLDYLTVQQTAGEILA
ncbi:MAG: SPOR domain-containing protein [Bacillota bacterium]|jgi:hypothetical protein